MKKLVPILFGAAASVSLGLVMAASADTRPTLSSPVQYTADGQLKFPADYHEWVFLSSGFGMTYGPMGANHMDSRMFDNVFVNPASYREFLKTGHWPDKTMFVLEGRNSKSHASINKDGHFQTELMGVEAEVKDSTAKPGEWTFYGFGTPANPATAVSKPIPRAASCYSCHATNTAVENTFVQFYPDLYDVARKKGTINPGFAMEDSH